MSREIQQALELLNQRKAAIREGQGRDGLTFIGPDEIRALCSGFDLDPDELQRTFENATLQGVTVFNAIHGGGQHAAFGVMFLDGLAVGLLIAQAREKEAARG